MALQKRKTVSKVVAGVRRNSASEKAKQKAEEECTEQEAPTDQEMHGDESQTDEIDEEAKTAELEEATQSARRKELKSMYIDELKGLASKSGLEMCKKKEDTIAALIEQEATARAAVREQAAKVRQVVVQKKAGLEATAIPELKKQCADAGIKGNLSKPERVEQLLRHWQENDGVDKALTKAAFDARERELASMDKADLQVLCEKADVSPFVREVMADRIVRQEVAAGCFERPRLPTDEKEVPVSAKSSDVVEALLANEANRKKEKELKQQQAEAEANTMKKWKALSLDELKKAVTAKGREAVGKKDDLVAVLMEISRQESADAARKAALSSMSTTDLKQLVMTHGLEASKKEDMVGALLAHEEKLRDDLRTYELKVADALTKKKEELGGMTPSELKDLCVSKGLKPGLSKEDRVERLVQAARTDGEVDKMLAAASCEARRAELLTMEVEALAELCNRKSIDPLAKEIMLERLLAHEREFGRTELDGPAPKRARTLRK